MTRRREATPPKRLDRWGTINAFIETDLAGITTETRSPAVGLIWFVLFARANGKTGRVKASSRWLATVTGMARSTVILSIQSLVTMGLLERDDDRHGWYVLRHTIRDGR